jgi:hypothetical protein
MEQKDKLKRVPLYERLPEIYRIKDREQIPPGQLEHYLALVEQIFSDIHKNIETLYHDLFIDTCADWVIHYIGDLLGVSHIKGDARTLRADAADAIALRRRKGTPAGLEQLAYNLTGWASHIVELRKHLLWNQHLNHLRPGTGGTVNLKAPARLSLLGTPFDPFAYTAQLEPPEKSPPHGKTLYNLPNTAVYVWRLKDYQVQATKPVIPITPPDGYVENETAVGTEAIFIVCFDVNPCGEPIQLFNTYQYNPDRTLQQLSGVDETPNPIPRFRLDEGSPTANPLKYVEVETYDPETASMDELEIAAVGLRFHLPSSSFSAAEKWTFRGEKLHCWDSGHLPTPALKNREIAVDPAIGRVLLGVDSKEEVDALQEHLLMTYTYGAVGPLGAHPVARPYPPRRWNNESLKTYDVKFTDGESELKDALDIMEDDQYIDRPLIIRIRDSRTYKLDIRKLLPELLNTTDEPGKTALCLRRSLIIRAADQQRPVIKLAVPLRFRPHKVTGEDDQEQKKLDAVMSHLTVRLEGVYITGDTSFEEGEPLVARTALNRMEIIDSTLAPGGHRQIGNTRATIRAAMRLESRYGFSDNDEYDRFNQIPEIDIRRSVTGPLHIDTAYRLALTHTIVDAGEGVAQTDTDVTAVSGIPAEAEEEIKWGPETCFNGITVFGRVQVERISGQGAIFVQPLQVLEHQSGCIKYSYFTGREDRLQLPQNHGCVYGTEHRLRFTSEIHGHPAYGQFHRVTSLKIREGGPDNDAMGAYGFLKEAHKWRNLSIRCREFIPVGIKPLLIPVT